LVEICLTNHMLHQKVIHSTPDGTVIWISMI